MMPDLDENGVVLLVDLSPLISTVLDALRKQIVSYLCRIQRNPVGESFFNVIVLSSWTKSFAEHVIPCTGANIVSVNNWLQEQFSEESQHVTLTAKSADTTGNLLEGFVLALADAKVSRVLLITGGLCDEKPFDVLKCVRELSHGKPIYVCYIHEDRVDENDMLYLNSLAQLTKGCLVKVHRKDVASKSNFLPAACGDAVQANYSPGSNEHGLYGNSGARETANPYISKVPNDVVRGQTSRSPRKLDYEFPASLLVMKGKTVLAKRKIFGDFHLGVIVDVVSSNLFAILFDVDACGLENVQIADIVSYEDAKRHVISKGDKVLAPYLSHGRYTPGTVVQDKLLSADSQVLVKLLSGDNLKLKTDDVIRIPEQLFERLHKQYVASHASSRNQPSSAKSGCDADDSVDDYDEHIQFLESCKQKMPLKAHKSSRKHREKSLHRSVVKPLVMDDLDMRDNHDTVLPAGAASSDSDCTGDDYYLRPRHRPVRILSVPGRNDDRRDFADQLRPRSADLPRNPHPPRRKVKKLRKVVPKFRPQIITRSRSVGSLEAGIRNGRPTPCDTSNLRSSQTTYVTYDSDLNVRPDHVEYQTANGVPLPRATDRNFRLKSSKTWSPDAVASAHDGSWRHHDIISHRTVDYGKPTEHKTNSTQLSKEVASKRQLDNLKTRRALHEEKKLAERETRDEQVAARNQQIRKDQIDRARDHQTKVKITIESDQQKLQFKKILKENHLLFEQERENKNQEWKHQRLDAMRQKREELVKDGDSKQQVALTKEEDKLKSRVSAHQKRNEIEKAKLEKDIEVVENKLKKLQAERRHTDAKMDALKRENDAHRDMGNYVKSNAQDRIRSYVLP